MPSKILIVFFSQGGTTERVAQAIATGLGAAGHQVGLCNLAAQQPPPAADYDVIGIGSPAYYFRPAFPVADYLAGLPELGGRASFSFVLYGTVRGDTGTALRRALAAKGATDVGAFACRGADYFLGYLQRGYLFSPGHPTAEELGQAEDFGRQIAERLAGQRCVAERKDPLPAPLYRLERFFLNRWLTRQVYSRLFRVDRERCSACGLCVKKCPTHNLAADQHGHPTWGRACILCLLCERKCPEEAITSPISWSLIGPMLDYNVRRALANPGLDHQRVAHRRGKTRAVSESSIPSP